MTGKHKKRGVEHMKELTMFYLDDCGYCHMAHKALDELMEEKQAYRDIKITKIEENQNMALAEQYDYYAVPSFFDGKKKLFEAHLYMSYEDIREEVRKVLDYALAD